MSLLVREGLPALTTHLKNRGVDGAPREARLLLAHVIGVDPGRITLMAGDTLASGDLEKAYALGVRRAGGEPMSHILGYREFWGRRFHVDARVLDPRPETEILITVALEEGFSKVLDLGTGSGCILLTLLAERTDALGVGVDMSAEALEVAETNATLIAVADRCALEQSDWFSAVTGQFDLIVSNPPYIAAKEMPGLSTGVRKYEPRLALTDESDGLDAYRALVPAAPQHLNPGGRLIVEIGPTQGAAVSALFAKAGLSDIQVHHDLDGRDRVVSGRKTAE